MWRHAFIAVSGLLIVTSACASRHDVPARASGTPTPFVQALQDDHDPLDLAEFSFTVVDGRSGKPIQDAEVLWEQDPTDGRDDFLGVYWLDAWSAKMRPDLDVLESRLTSLGNRIRSDARGRVVLPGSEFPSVFCREGTLLGGTESLDCDESDVCRLHLWPDGDIRVRVVDAAGRPLANTGVMLVGTFAKSHSSYVEQRAWTNSDGLAVLRHGFPLIASYQLASDARSWRIAVESLPAGLASLDLDPEALPREPVTIRMPPTAAVEIDVRETDGSPCPVDLPIGLRELDAKSSEWLKRPDTGAFRRQGTDELWTKSVGGKARFAQIAPGRELIAYAARNAASRVNVVQFDGPTRSGGTVRASIVVAADSVILTGSANGPRGTKLADERLRVSLYGAQSPELEKAINHPQGQASHGPSGIVTADAWGRFTVEFALDAAHHGRPVLLIAYRRSDGVELTKRLELQDVWSAGRHDLGDIFFDEVPIMAAGVVVDETGAPISGVWMCVERTALHSIDEFQTNERGEFEWRSAVPHDEVRLEISKKGYLPSWRREVAEVGRTDWRIVLQKGSSLVGRVLLPAGAYYRDYSCSVDRLDENDSGRIATGGGDVEEDGTFGWEDCEAGTYSVTLRSARENEFSPFRLDGIEVRRGQTVDLGVIDLRNAWRPVTVRVVAADGELVDGCFTFGAHGSDLLGEMRTTVWPREFSEGSVTIPRKDEEELDLAITVPGLRTKVFHEVHDGDVLRMEPALRVRIALSKNVSQPPEGQRLLLGLFPEDADQRVIVLKGPRWPTVAIDARGEAELLVPAPGRHRLRWILERGTGMEIETRYWQEPPQVIEVADQPESQRIEIVCPIDPATAWKEDG